MTTPLRIVFAGTPDFAAIALRALLASPHQVIAVYTQPDRPAGRGRKLHPSPVKQLAQQHNLPVFQPVDLKSAETLAELATLKPDVMVVAAYGLLLPQAVLDLPQHGCLNIHASLLPRWRGAAPIQRAILAGDTRTGITIMQMDAGLDTGNMLYRTACPITADTNAAELHDQLAEMGAQAIVTTLDQLQAGELRSEPQNNAYATYAKKLQKQEANIDWTQNNHDIERLIRAFNPWPVAQTTINGQTLRIWQAKAIETFPDSEPGTVITTDKTGIDISCGRGMLRLLCLQPAGKKAMDTAAFLNGYPEILLKGTKLGS